MLWVQDEAVPAAGTPQAHQQCGHSSGRGSTADEIESQTAWDSRQALVAAFSPFMWLQSPSELCLPAELGLAQAPGADGGAAGIAVPGG